MIRRTSAVALAVLAAVSCTLLGDREIKQCSSDADCTFARRPICSPDFLCTAGERDAGGVDAADVGGCKSHLECAIGEACIEGGCRVIGDQTAPCGNFPSDKSRYLYREPNAIIVGIYLFAASGGVEVVAADRALNEINDALETRGARFRLGGIYCKKDDRLKAGSAASAAKMIAKFGARVMIGQFEASELASADFRKAVVDSKITVMSTLGNITEVQEPTSTKDVRYRLFADQLQALIGTTNAFDAAMTEARRRAEFINVINAGDPLRLRFLVTAGNSTTEARFLHDKLVQSPVIKTGAWQLASGPIEVKATFEESASRPTGPAAAAAGLQGETPHIIVALGGDEIAETMESAEATWSGKRPVWVVGPRTKYNGGSLTRLLARQRFNERVIGVDFNGDRMKSAAFSVKTSNPDARAFDILYDGLYALALGLVRTDRIKNGALLSTFSDADVLQGFDEVMQPNGALTDIPDGFGGAIDAVRLGGLVKMSGVSGEWIFPPPPNADAKRGARQATGYSYFCFRGTEKSTTQYLEADALKDFCAFDSTKPF